MNGVRPDAVDESLLTAMGAAGCRRIVFSFEHLAEKNPGAVGYSEQVARQAVADARSAGMRVGGYFMVGLPNRGLVETLDSIRRAMRLGLDYAKFTPYWFAPGSPWGREREKLESTRLSPRVARNLCRAAELSFLSRPRPLGRLVRDIAADPEVARVLAARALELLRNGGPVPMRD